MEGMTGFRIELDGWRTKVGGAEWYKSVGEEAEKGSRRRRAKNLPVYRKWEVTIGHAMVSGKDAPAAFTTDGGVVHKGTRTTAPVKLQQLSDQAKLMARNVLALRGWVWKFLSLIIFGFTTPPSSFRRRLPFHSRRVVVCPCYFWSCSVIYCMVAWCANITTNACFKVCFFWGVFFLLWPRVGL